MNTKTARTGSKMSDRAAILNSPIPHGSCGRNLTSSECSALRAFGWSLSPRWIVVRQSFDDGHFGIVYYPASGGGYNHAGIYVETK